MPRHGWTIGSYIGRRAYGCTKQAYASAGAAEAHVRSLERRGIEWGHLGPVEVYRCRHCGKFHVGHKRREGGGDGR